MSCFGVSVNTLVSAWNVRITSRTFWGIRRLLRYGCRRVGKEERKATRVSIWWGKSAAVWKTDVVLNRSVRGYESCCLQYDPDTKCVSQQRKHPLSPRPKHRRTIPCAGKVMLTMFFDLLRPPFLIDCLPKGINVSADLSDETLEHLKCAIKAERRSKLSRGFVLLHNNARPQSWKKHSWEAATVSMGSSSTLPLQSIRVPLWLSCVLTNEKGTQKSALPPIDADIQ